MPVASAYDEEQSSEVVPRQLLDRAEAEGTTTSELIREALRRYLRAA
jgi:hypothetical protein